FNNLLAAAVSCAEAQRSSAGTGRKKKIMRRVVAEIKNALPVSAAVPINPRCKTKVGAVRNIRWQAEKIIRSVQRERLPAVSVGITGYAQGESIVSIAGTIEGIVLELKLRNAARTAGRQGLLIRNRRRVIAIHNSRGRERAIVRHH